MYSNIFQANLLFSEGVDHLDKEKEPQPSTSGAALEIDAPIRDDGFGGNLAQDIMGMDYCYRLYRWVRGGVFMFF